MRFFLLLDHTFSLTCCILLIQHPITVTIILQCFFPVKDKGRSCRASGALAVPLCVHMQNSPFFPFFFPLSHSVASLLATSLCHQPVTHSPALQAVIHGHFIAFCSASTSASVHLAADARARPTFPREADGLLQTADAGRGGGWRLRSSLLAGVCIAHSLSFLSLFVPLHASRKQPCLSSSHPSCLCCSQYR